jgi:hypothetical protein
VVRGEIARRGALIAAGLGINVINGDAPHYFYVSVKTAVT